MINVLFYLALLTCTSIYGLSRGGVPERLAISFILIAVACSALSLPVSYLAFSSPEYALLFVDTCLLLAMLWLALRADRHWPLVIVALLLNQVALEIANWFMPSINRNVYLIVHAALAYPKLVIILIATFRHQRRLRTNGNDASWSVPWRRTAAQTPPLRQPIS